MMINLICYNTSMVEQRPQGRNRIDSYPIGTTVYVISRSPSAPLREFEATILKINERRQRTGRKPRGEILYGSNPSVLIEYPEDRTKINSKKVQVSVAGSTAAETQQERVAKYAALYDVSEDEDF